MLGKHLNHCEDSLTASVFSHLLHLPIELFWRILRAACYTTCLPEVVGEPREFDSWPKWDPAGTGNKTYIEPDLFIRFEDFDLIIEAKRWDEGMQSRNQWQNELIAYGNEYGEEVRPVKLIALGGIHTEKDDELRHTPRLPKSHSGGPAVHELVCPVHMCRWRSLLEQCKKMLRELDHSKSSGSYNPAYRRILNDVIDLFACHGYSTGRWFADFDFASHPLSLNVGQHRQIFSDRSAQLVNA
jgi:hypothetical protein